MNAPIFIVGTERSGSNLLRLILNSHSAITVPHPPHILHFFRPLEKKYGNLTISANLKRLVNDVLALLAVHIYPWEIRPEAAEIIANVNHPDLLGVFFSIYNTCLRHSGKRRWGCKSTFMIHHLAKIIAVCPAAKFIFLVRDPRDVAASSRKSIFSPFHPYFTAALWRQQQLAGLRFLDSARGASCHLVRYEDLIAEPAAAVKAICAFIGEAYEPAMLEYYRTAAARKSERLSTSWKNTASPILADNKNTYLNSLSRAEIRIVEGVTADLLVRLGYQDSCPENFRPYRPTPLTRWWYRLLNFYRAVVVESGAMRHDRNYRQFWRRRIFLYRLRLNLHLRRHRGQV